jgi:hypothetical protein
MANFKPQDFVGCNLTDKQFLDDDGFLLSCGVYSAFSVRPMFKQFGDYTLNYRFSKGKSSIILIIYNGGNALGIADYFTHHPPIFRCSKPIEIVSKSSFLEYMMSLDKDLANWMLWNI